VNRKSNTWCRPTWWVVAFANAFSFGFAANDSFTVRLATISELQIDGPCLASLIGSPAKSCVQWQPNVFAPSTFLSSTRLIFSGAGDSFLHVTDADTAKPVAQIETVGRVVTETKWSADGSIIYVGTDKGVVHGFDAYSFAPRFSFQADSKINNNLTIVNDALVFSSALGSVYSLDGRTGGQNWYREQPLATERLRLVSASNIIVNEQVIRGEKTTNLLVPHADGYVLVIDPKTGESKQRYSSSGVRAKGFPDIVARMVVLKNRLWFASYNSGLVSIDLTNGLVREHLPITEIDALSTDGTILFAASAHAVFAILENGKILWKNDISTIKSRNSPLGFPFSRLQEGGKKMLFGNTGLLIHGGRVIMASSLGSIGIFDKVNGQLKQIVGNSVGFGPIEWLDPESFMAVSVRGLLMIFKIGNR
jgi:outer membrane protein assembly factor BamB